MRKRERERTGGGERPERLVIAIVNAVHENRVRHGQVFLLESVLEVIVLLSDSGFSDRRLGCAGCGA